MTANALIDNSPATQLVTGVQAIGELLQAVQRRERQAGRHTGILVSGYPGSPLGGLDLTLARVPGLQTDHDIHLRPAVNEELAATAVWGSQTIPQAMTRQRDGVLGVWYGKHPGLDRACDPIRHGNMQGVDPNGGVLVLVGDDPAAKSSTIPSASETTLAELMLPVLAPSDPTDVIRLGLYGVAMSRLSGCWVGMKITTDVADGLSLCQSDLDVEPIRPEIEWDGRPWSYQQAGVTLTPYSLIAEAELVGPRWKMVEAFASANPLNVMEVDPPRATVGIVAYGKTYADLRQALADMHVTDDELFRAGVRLLRVGMPYPLAAQTVDDFARDLETVLVVEEKRPLLEGQLRALLYGRPHAPLILGKSARDGRPLVPREGELTAAKIGAVLREQLRERLDFAPAVSSSLVGQPLPLARTPFFCSGCPHNRSTVVPDGSFAGGGIGCHGMVAVIPRESSRVTGVTQMGGEGAQWIGQAPFTATNHIFQNLGDGTLMHSGLLAIQACIAADLNITYKVLYNRAIAMTGGQDVPDALDIPALARVFETIGVRKTVVCTEEPKRYRRGLPNTVIVRSRDDLDAVQRELRDVSGVTVIIYDQVCAAEARRLRKRGLAPVKTQRVVINERVCEGCGDCGRASNCLSLQPVVTPFGVKTSVDQSSCNTDYSCLDGDCPSFVTVEQREPKRPRPRVPAECPEPQRSCPDDHAELVLTGIGGTGIVTVNQILAAAARAEGFHVAGLDQTGLSQKAGPVTSHLRLSRTPVAGSRVTTHKATALIGFDALVAADPRQLAYVAPTTSVVVSSSWTPPGSLVGRPPVDYDTADITQRLAAAIEAPPVLVDAVAAARTLVGDPITANLLLLGAAYQAGALPLRAEHIEEAIRDRGVQAEMNTTAFRWGRTLVHQPELGNALRPRSRTPEHTSKRHRQKIEHAVSAVALPDDLADTVRLFAAELTAYQDWGLASDYLDAVTSVWRAERPIHPSGELTVAAARQLHRLTAYKDEYEVARLMLGSDLRRQLDDAVPGSRRLRYHLHPPMLRSLGMRRKIRLGRWAEPAFRALTWGRHLRGTPLDPFGYTSIRRLERELASQFKNGLSDLATTLTEANHSWWLAWVNAADLVRGFEAVKLTSVERYRDELERLAVQPTAPQPDRSSSRLHRDRVS